MDSDKSTITSQSNVKFSEFTKIGFRIGKVLSATLLTKARKPAYKLQVDFGEIGKKVTSAQLPANYKVDQIVGKLVVGVINLPPRRIAGVKSEALIVGFPDSQGNVFLLNTRYQEPAIGSKLAEGGQHADEINIDDFQKADIRSATVLSIEPLEENEDAFQVKLDVGEYGEKLGFVSDIYQEAANTLIGSQVAALLNLEPEDIPNQQCNAVLLTFLATQSDSTKAVRLPLGVDGNGQVANGGKLLCSLFLYSYAFFRTRG